MVICTIHREPPVKLASSMVQAAGAFAGVQELAFQKRELQLPLASCLEVATPIGDLGHKIAITSGDFMLIYTFQLYVF